MRIRHFQCLLGPALSFYFFEYKTALQNSKGNTVKLARMTVTVCAGLTPAGILALKLNASSLLSASAELLVLYNICCFHDVIETSAPTEIHWITLIHYKNDINIENCFQNGGHPPSWIWKNFHFWSCDLYLHVIRHLFTESHVNRPMRRRDIVKKTIFNMASVRHLEFEKFQFLSNSHPRNGNLHLWTKFDRNRIIHDWDN